MPLERVKSLLFGHYLVSMPFLNYGGPVGSDAAVRALAARGVELADQGKAKLLELRSRVALPIDLPVSHRKITVLLDLPEGDSKPLWDGIPAKVRSQVRRPQKEGVTVTFGADQLDGFYHVFAHHMRDLGTPVQSRRLFEEIVRAFPEDGWFGCAYLNGRAIAGGCGFRWGNEFEMTWASSLREFNKIAPNMLLYWAFMERCVAQGVRLFNFGRCTPDGGTHRFKKQWGSRDEPLWWYQHGAPAASTPSPDDGAYSWGPRIWKHLPLPLANLVGPHIVKSLP
jgi:FemAB-related protein (PEP-CTERM system-associated)